jgi:hypothetical protein
VLWRKKMSKIELGMWVESGVIVTRMKKEGLTEKE